jgi:hypothetical protein
MVHFYSIKHINFDKTSILNRRKFLTNTALASATAFSIPSLLLAQKTVANEPLPLEKVKEFVAAGHNNLEKVKSLLLETPTLIYAAWDWGNGDCETALEGAGHVGNKEIANYLIEQGARTNLFVLSMLGKTGIVKAFIDAYPTYLKAKGPHGFTLLHHAQRGGDDAKELVEYFISKGLIETKMKL